VGAGIDAVSGVDEVDLHAPSALIPSSTGTSYKGFQYFICELADSVKQHGLHKQRANFCINMRLNIQYIRQLLSWILEFPLVIFGSLWCLEATQGPRGQPNAVCPPFALGEKLTSVHPGQTPRPP
jgi:hypothetical protein